MKRKVLIILFPLFFAGALGAQDYHTGLGLRASVSPGISVKHFITTNMAGEGILTVRWGGFNVTGLAEWHLPVFDTEGFYFLYGGGAHLGVWDRGRDYYGSTRDGTTVFLGIDGIIGLEYAFPDIPLSIGLDWKPGMNVLADFGFFFDDLAISLRYLFR
jgi:hypothetical protein